MGTEYQFDPAAFENEGSGSQKFWKPDKELVRIRLMPTPSDLSLPWVVCWYHHNMPFNPTGTGVVCGKAGGGMCPVCAHVSELYNAGDADNGGRRRAKPFYYANIVEVGDKTSNIPTDKLKVVTYRFGKQVHEGLRKAFYPSAVATGDIDDISEVTDNKPIDITHPETGYNIAIIKERIGAEKWNIKYSIRRAKKLSPLPDMKRLLSERPDLHQYVIDPDPEVLQRNYDVLCKGYTGEAPVVANQNAIKTGPPQQSGGFTSGGAESIIDDSDIDF